MENQKQFDFKTSQANSFNMRKKNAPSTSSSSLFELSFPLCWLFLLQLIGTYLFTSGFFLSRFEVSSKSTCLDQPPLLVDFNSKNNIECWVKPKFEKAVIIVIDALRFEYMNFQENNPKSNRLNHLTYINHLLKTQPNNALLFDSIVDPPTVTMQRIKGLTTGGMPTFIDVSENFMSSEITEDNLISQLVSNGKKLAFMGDDTWESLYPRKFNVSFPFPSFNVNDLDTVDDGIISNLVPVLTGPPNKWDVLIAHFLGVDHVGHRYHVDHPTMLSKLEQMNKVISEVVASIDNKTLLVILGDHGSTQEGDHGGSSFEETHAGLFFYSKSKLTSISTTPTPTPTPTQIVRQIDIVPTISLLLGIPIPYASLGSLISPLFSENDFEMAVSNYVVSWQILRYVHTYQSISRVFSESVLNELENRFQNATSQLKQSLQFAASSSSSSSSLVLKSITTNLEDLNFQIYETCKHLWTTFDVNAMLSGSVVLLLASIFSILVYLSYPYHSNSNSNSNTSFLYFSLVVILCFSFFIARISITQFQILDSDSYLSWFPSSVVVGVGILFLLFSGFFDFKKIASNLLHDHLTSPTFLWAVFLLIAFEIGQFSNSFVEAQPKVLRFLIVSFIVVKKFTTIGKSTSVFRDLIPFLSFLVSIVLMDSFSQPTARYEWEHTVDFSFILIVIFPTICLGFLNSYFIQKHVSTTFKTFEIAHNILNTIVISVYWTCRSTDSVSLKLLNFLPWIIYLGFVLQLINLLFFSSHSIPNNSHSFPVGIFFSLIISLSWPISLVLGLFGSLWICLFFMGIISFVIDQNFSTNNNGANNNQNIFENFILFAMLSLKFFFSTGHKFELGAFHWGAAFVGMNEMNFAVSGVLIGLNTISSFLLYIFSIPLVLHFGFFNTNNSKQSKQTIANTSHTTNFSLLTETMKASLPIQLFFSLNAVLTSLFVFGHPRHLMMWRIFAPKYLYEVALALIIDIIVFLLLFLISHFSRSNARVTKPSQE